MGLISQMLVEQRTKIPSQQRATHTYVIGQPGTGKSRVLESWIAQDILAGQGVAVIDPHGDLFHNLVCFLAVRPELWDRVVLIDPTDKTWAVGFNPLESVPGQPHERTALFLTDVVMKIWKLNPTHAPRLLWLLSNSFLALSDLGLTLLDLPRFLLDAEYRTSLVPRLSNDSARSFFTYEFPQSQAAVHQWTMPLLNKIGSLIFDPDVRLLVAGQTKVKFRDVIDRRLILLANTSKGLIGEASSSLLGAFIVAQFQKAALSRADMIKRSPFYLYLDEFQNYTTDNIQDILSESRKYSLALTLAHQYLEQLSSDLRSAVLNTTGTIACFRVGYHDAQHLAKEIFPNQNFLSKSKLNTSMKPRWPFVALEERQRAPSWDSLAQQLSGLPSREFWLRWRGNLRPARLRAFDIPDAVLTTEVRAGIEGLRQASGSQFGRLKTEARRLLHTDNVPSEWRESAASRQEQPYQATNIPLWGN